MSNRLPVEVNPFRLIEQNRTLEGRLPGSQFTRLQELVVDDQLGDFLVKLDFTRSAGSQLPMIRGQVQGRVPLECQRCLQPMSRLIDHEVNVVLTRELEPEQVELEGYELYIIENERLFIQGFIEDEILLALPLVARHESCDPVRPLREVSAAEQENEYTKQKDTDNPFAVLKDLKDWNKPE